MDSFDFSTQGRRPTVEQIIKRWKHAGKPKHFTVEYGETCAEFENPGLDGWLRGWLDSGNGCRGVDRGAVVQALNAIDKEVSE